MNEITIVTRGGGGAGGGSTNPGPNSNHRCGAGGGGGAWASSTISVTPGDTYWVVVADEAAGVSGNNGNNGLPSFFGTSISPSGAIVLAAGGSGGQVNTGVGTPAGGQGGSSAISIGDVIIAGEDGEDGDTGFGASSGAGGDGANSGGTGGAAVSGGTNPGNPGNPTGGGGSGGRSGFSGLAQAGGSGAIGFVSITYACESELELTSAAVSDDQEICLGENIIDITYEVSGSATGAVVSGLPDGVSGSFSAGVFTISGTPTETGTFDYTVTTTGSDPCDEDEVMGSIVVNSLPAIICPSDFIVCIDGGLVDLTDLVSPLGGDFTGDHLSGNNFDPVAAGLGSHAINYEFTEGVNGCTNDCDFMITVSDCPDVSGMIFWSNDPDIGVNSTEIAVSGTMMDNTTTGMDGLFEFALAQGGDYTITPSKTGGTVNGVDISDIQAIQRHVTFLERFTDPYQLIAADVNGDGVISTFDAAIIGQFLLGNAAAFPLFDESWRFVPANYVFSDPENPWVFPQSIEINNLQANVNADFIGIKVGDVTGDADPSGFMPNIPTRDLQDNLSWRVSDNQWAAPGELLEVKVKSDYFQDFASWQMALQFDASAVELVEVLTEESALNLGSGNFGTYSAEKGELRALWSNSTGKNISLAEDDYVFTLVFRSLTHEGKISDYIWLEDAIIPARAYNQDFQLSGVELEFVEEEVVSVNDTQVDGFRLLQNRPNPFSHTTVIGFEIPQSASIVLQITDISGKLVESIEKDATTGYNEIRLDADLPSGMYFYELITPYGSLVSRMIVE